MTTENLEERTKKNSKTAEITVGEDCPGSYLSCFVFDLLIDGKHVMVGDSTYSDNALRSLTREFSKRMYEADCLEFDVHGRYGWFQPCVSEFRHSMETEWEEWKLLDNPQDLRQAIVENPERYKWLLHDIEYVVRVHQSIPEDKIGNVWPDNTITLIKQRTVNAALNTFSELEKNVDKKAEFSRLKQYFNDNYESIRRDFYHLSN